ncbi:copper resistance protein NlpE [Moheibacter sediminis]|uniref:NlpE N-terminal domain-containing protein n=1 Tax=Moheibacter sediminis TaxID=1434700 RepID=A0A1W2BD74_9FLAO|nr:copper resistance protein NlpE [Moheibacter sediminis]SMC70682.1 NlpE N-terminal domain-containing protein [Moheibacter sediminis]
MKNQILMLAVAGFVLFSCETKKEESVINPDEKQVVDEHNAKNSLDILGTYKGILPCADCEGIETEITLSKDETYTKKMKYLGKDEKVFEEMGDYTWKEDGNTLVLENINSDIVEYFVSENSLTQLDMEGNKITGDLSGKYILNK